MKIFEIFKKSKGQLNSLSTAALAFVVIAIVLGFGALILSQVQGQVALMAGNTSAAANATSQGINAVNTFSSWLPILAIIVVGAVILGYLFFFGGEHGGNRV